MSNQTIPNSYSLTKVGTLYNILSGNWAISDIQPWAILFLYQLGLYLLITHNTLFFELIIL